MTKHSSLDWRPPAEYPASLTSTHDEKFLLTFPDFRETVEAASVNDVLPRGRAAVKGWLRKRSVARQEAPFASNPATVAGSVVMITTEGWDIIEEEEVADD